MSQTVRRHPLIPSHLKNLSFLQSHSGHCLQSHLLKKYRWRSLLYNFFSTLGLLSLCIFYIYAENAYIIEYIGIHIKYIGIHLFNFCLYNWIHRYSFIQFLLRIYCVAASLFQGFAFVAIMTNYYDLFMGTLLLWHMTMTDAICDLWILEIRVCFCAVSDDFVLHKKKKNNWKF